MGYGKTIVIDVSTVNSAVGLAKLIDGYRNSHNFIAAVGNYLVFQEK